MEIGDSILFANQFDALNAYSVAYNMNIKTTRRKVDGGWRLWRIG
jgi:hypothetical protein